MYPSSSVGPDGASEDANRQIEQLKAVSDIGENRKHDNIFVCEKGVRFKLSKVKAFVLQEAQKRVKEPTVPSVYIKEDDRWEENPNDPDYLDARDQTRADRSVIVTNILLGLGTRVDGAVPNDVFDVGSDEWVQELSFAGIEVPAGDVPSEKLPRYVAWMKFYLLENNEIRQLIDKISRYSGLIDEVEVAEKIESFPGEQERSTNLGASVNGFSADRDYDTAPD